MPSNDLPFDQLGWLMSGPANHKKIPWAILITVGLLIGYVFFSLRLFSSSPSQISWSVAEANVLAAVAAFLTILWLQNLIWGVVAAVLLITHPLHRHWAEPLALELWVDGLGLAFLAIAIASWRLAVRTDFILLGWIVLAAAGAVISGVLWAGWPNAAAVFSLLALVGIPAGGYLAALQVRRGSPKRPYPGNIACAILSALIIHFGGLTIAYLRTGNVSCLTLSILQLPSTPSWQLLRWGPHGLEKWLWPSTWIVGPLVVWGLWRTAWRGWREWRKQLPPAPWLLTFYAPICFFVAACQSEGQLSASLAPLSSLAVLLTVFGIADSVRGLSERLILQPPAESDSRA